MARRLRRCELTELLMPKSAAMSSSPWSRPRSRPDGARHQPAGCSPALIWATSDQRAVGCGTGQHPIRSRRSRDLGSAGPVPGADIHRVPRPSAGGKSLRDRRHGLAGAVIARLQPLLNGLPPPWAGSSSVPAAGAVTDGTVRVPGPPCWRRRCTGASAQTSSRLLAGDAGLIVPASAAGCWAGRPAERASGAAPPRDDGVARVSVNLTAVPGWAIPLVSASGGSPAGDAGLCPSAVPGGHRERPLPSAP